MAEEPREVIYKLYECINLANEGLEIFSPVIDGQLRLFESSDQLEEAQKESLGFSITKKLQDLDGYYLAESLKIGKLDEYLKTMDSRFVFENNEIRSKLKDSNTYQDLEKKFLTKEEILTMSDLKILSQINAYQNPYSGQRQGRTIYEHFFGSMISFVFKPLITFVNSDYEFIRFQIIHESSYLLHLISQNTTSVIQCIMEIITIGNVRIRTSGLSIRMDLRLPEFQHPIIKNSLENMQNGSKVYTHFKNHNFSKTISKLSQDDSTWLSKIEKFQEILNSTLEQSQLQADCIFENLVTLKNMLKNCKNSYENLEIYLADLLLFVTEAQHFLRFFMHNKTGYHKFYHNLHKILSILENLEHEYPTIYGGYTTPSPRTPRNQPSARQNINTVKIPSPLSSPIHSTKKKEIRLDLSKLKK